MHDVLFSRLFYLCFKQPWASIFAASSCKLTSLKVANLCFQHWALMVTWDFLVVSSEAPAHATHFFLPQWDPGAKRPSSVDIFIRTTLRCGWSSCWKLHVTCLLLGDFVTKPPVTFRPDEVWRYSPPPFALICAYVCVIWDWCDHSMATGISLRLRWVCVVFEATITVRLCTHSAII